MQIAQGKDGEERGMREQGKRVCAERLRLVPFSPLETNFARDPRRGGTHLLPPLPRSLIVTRNFISGNSVGGTRSPQPGPI